MLSSEEIEIIDFLRPLGKQFASPKEVCRRAGGKLKFQKDPYWAKPLLKRMEKKGFLQSNENGHYRIKPEDDKRKKVPMSPAIQKILNNSSKDFGNTSILEIDEDYVNLSKGNKTGTDG
jgi:hypothetical protein